jgi:hypothetical protein
MQLFNGTADFGENAVVTIVRRGNTTTGVVNGVKNVLDLGCALCTFFAAILTLIGRKLGLIGWRRM